jgi:hypothetical protein
MIRDERTKALINPDADALYKYKMERDKTRRLAKLECDVETLKKKVEALLKLIETNIEKNNGKVNN